MPAPPSIPLPRPIVYPEKTVEKTEFLERLVLSAQSWVVDSLARQRTRRLWTITKLVKDHSEKICNLSDDELRQAAKMLRHGLRTSNCDDINTVAQCFAIVREASGRVLGMRHHDVQILGSYVMLRGMIAEMQTGEGKTLTATLAATTAAIAGWPVHVVTVNDYLAERDAEIMIPLYEFFGLSVGIVVSGQDPVERSAAYACDITYCTNSELAFDYLRDRLELGHTGGNIQLKVNALIGENDCVQSLKLPGLYFAIVDELDSVLVDEARTPLIISGESDLSKDMEKYDQALEIASQLQEGSDFQIRIQERSVVLTKSGGKKVKTLTEPMGGVWRRKILREELIIKAISALLLYHRDEHYLVADDKVQIIDEYTGRVMPDRFWGEGLHQMIELKETCEMTGGRVTLARMTYQRFFRRYERLGGMTGTCSEIARELWRVYRLAVAKIPTHKPLRRIVKEDQVFMTQDEKWNAIVDEVRRLHAIGVPVLVGTRSVAASEVAATYFKNAGLPAMVLNAAQDSDEADIVGDAGQFGKITIATNMAGRGTDIKVPDDVEALGGLHVIMSERHDSVRIDRQLEGRSARQGQAGCYQAMLALDDPLMEMDKTGLLAPMARSLMPILGKWVGRKAMKLAQLQAERLHARMRNDLLKMDEKLGNALAFTGKPE